MIEVRSPADGTWLAEVREHSNAEVEAVLARARAAQPAWGRASFTQRAAALRRILRRIRDDEPLLQTLIGESGKPGYEAELFERLYTLELGRYYTGRAGRRALADQFRRSGLLPHKRSRVIHHARGVVGVIGPWNWPLLNNFADAVAPLLAGNAVVLKPSEHTPLTSLRVAALWAEEGLPADVFQVVIGGPEAGRQLTASCDMIFFTGSHRAGLDVARVAAARLIPVVLELGGKSAMIVLRDADLARAARAAVWSAFAHSGQVCIRTERVFVEDAVADEFGALCADETRRLRLGPQAGAGIFDVGALTLPSQMAHVEAQIADAVAHGARVLCGGKRSPRSGNYFEPTLLSGATLAMKVMHEETFGPLLPILRVQDAEEALRLTNASTLGLSGSIWSRDTSRARELARRVESGSVCVNDVLLDYTCVAAPLGGTKQSGLGSRHGPESLRQFCRLQTIVEDAPLLGFVSGLVSRKLGFPYQQRTLAWMRRWMRLRH